MCMSVYVCVLVFFLTVVHQATPACPRQHVSSSCSPLLLHTILASLETKLTLLDPTNHLHTVLQRIGGGHMAEENVRVPVLRTRITKQLSFLSMYFLVIYNSRPGMNTHTHTQLKLLKI